MTYILKRISGNRETFEVEKIGRSVRKAYIDAGKCMDECENEILRLTEEVILQVKKEENIESDTRLDSRKTGKSPARSSPLLEKVRREA
jgi:hypothetical protein